MKIVWANLVSIVCVSGAFYLMLQGRDGWGWLLLIAVLGLHGYQKKSEE